MTNELKEYQKTVDLFHTKANEKTCLYPMQALNLSKQWKILDDQTKTDPTEAVILKKKIIDGIDSLISNPTHSIEIIEKICTELDSNLKLLSKHYTDNHASFGILGALKEIGKALWSLVAVAAFVAVECIFFPLPLIFDALAMGLMVSAEATPYPPIITFFFCLAKLPYENSAPSPQDLAEDVRKTTQKFKDEILTLKSQKNPELKDNSNKQNNHLTGASLARK